MVSFSYGIYCFAICLAVVSCISNVNVRFNQCEKLNDTVLYCDQIVAADPNYCSKTNPLNTHCKAVMTCPVYCMVSVLGYVKADGKSPDCLRASKWLLPATNTADGIYKTGVSRTSFCVRSKQSIPSYCDQINSRLNCPKTCNSPCDPSN